MQNLFTNFISNNEKVSNEANKELMDKIKNHPEFIRDLFEFLGEVLNSESNPILVKSVCIAIYKMIKKNWKKDFPDDELAQFIYDNLIGFIFVLPFDDRQLFYSPLFIFFHSSDYSKLIMGTCMEQINSDSISNNSTSLFIISHIIDICIFKNRFSEVAEYYSIAIEPILNILPQTIDYFKKISADQLTEDQKEEYYILTSLSLSFVDFGMAIIQQPSILNDIDPELHYFSFFEGILSFLQLDNLPFKLQKNISHFINSLISNLFFRANTSESILSIQENFKTQILPLIITSVFTSLSSRNTNQEACAYFFKVIRLMTIQKWCLEEIFNENFISNIMIPLCYIQDDDLPNYKDIPENFLALYYPLENKDTELVSTRISVADLLKLIGTHFDQYIDMILSCCTSNFLESEDELQKQLDLESRLYIISCVLEFRPDNSSIFQFLNDIITSDDQPLFIISTTLFALQHMTINKEYLNMLSSAIISKKEDTIISLFAVRLFNKTFDSQNPTCGNLLPSLLNTLIELSSCVTNEEPAKMLNKLISQFPEIIEENASELITTFLTIWQKLVEETSEKNCQRYLDLIISILHKMDKNLQIFSDKTNEFCEFFIYSIEKFYDSDFLNDYFEVINAFLEKNDNPNGDLYKLIPFICNCIFDDFENRETWLKFAVQFFINFVRKPGFFEFEDGLYAKQLFEFCEMILTKKNYMSSISSIFILYSAIIQVQGQNIDLASKALEYFDQDKIQPDLYVSSLVLLSSALYSSPETITQMINEKIFANISNNINFLKDTTENYICICLIGLCILALNENQESYLAAASVLKMLIGIKRMISDEEDDIEDQFGDQIGAGSFQSDSIEFFKDKTWHFILPFDTMNPYDFFFKATETTHYNDLLSKNEWQFILDYGTELNSEF